MTSPARSELLQVLAELSDLCPEVRMGQLIANLATMARGPTVEAIWDTEDEEMLAAAQHHVEFFRARNSPAA